MSIARRIDELSEEIRNYPTPIARCDEQLTGLIEERSRLLNEIRKRDVLSRPGQNVSFNAYKQSKHKRGS